MVLKLYMYESSLPARSILMTGAALGIQFEKKFVDMEKGEHRSPEFLKVSVTPSTSLLDLRICIADKSSTLCSNPC